MPEMRYVAEALNFLDWVDTVLNRMIQIGQGPTQQHGYHLLLDVLDGLDAERERTRGVGPGWPNDLWYGYRGGLVITADRIRAAMANIPDEPPPEAVAEIIERLHWFRVLRRDIAALAR